MGIGYSRSPRELPPAKKPKSKVSTYLRPAQVAEVVELPGNVEKVDIAEEAVAVEVEEGEHIGFNQAKVVETLFDLVTIGYGDNSVSKVNEKYSNENLFRSGHTVVNFYFDKDQTRQYSLNNEHVRWKLLDKLMKKGFSANICHKQDPMGVEWLSPDYLYRATVRF